MKGAEIAAALLRHLMQPKWAADVGFSSELRYIDRLMLAGYLTKGYLDGECLWQHDITEKGKEFIKYYGHGKAEGS